jgi:uncharacterized protein DUF6362
MQPHWTKAIACCAWHGEIMLGAQMARSGRTDDVLTVSDVERRILRACKTLRALPDREHRFQVLLNTWPQMEEDEGGYGYTEVVMPRFRPSPADVTDYLTALTWARAVTRNEFRYIWWRSLGYSFGRMGLWVGRSDETARRNYRDALLKIWYRACGGEAVS